MDGHTTCERAGGTPRVGRCIGRYITCPRHRTPVAPLACPPGAELSPLCRGPKCFVAGHLDATPCPELVGLPAHAFGAGVRARGRWWGTSPVTTSAHSLQMGRREVLTA